jgi:hypothetical protein
MPIIIDPADAPHDTITNCDECHNGVLDRVFNATLDNNKCLVCHGPAGGATLVETHHTPADRNCTDCHNVMRPMANASHIKPVVNGATVTFLGTDYVDGAGGGLCEVCHVSTQHHNDAGTGTPHYNTGCTNANHY